MPANAATGTNALTFPAPAASAPSASSPGAAEPDVPAVQLGQQSAHDRAERRADVDPGREDGEGAGAPRHVAGWVQMPDLGRDIALEAAGAHDQQQQCDEEALVERHCEMA